MTTIEPNELANDVADAHERSREGHSAQIDRDYPNGQGLVEVYCLHCLFEVWAKP